MIESGVERVTDGVHTEPFLSKGQTYRLNVVCVGTRSAQLEFAILARRLKSPPLRTTRPAHATAIRRLEVKARGDAAEGRAA
ncbi:hypothetical protein [Streptomyces sp. NL15-2K]|uniref:hypothetical protein n=1 Tax=Streptomyces sp. NL15-2K TaxID=376149 RepID=UPI000F569858|nr:MULTISPECIES: hypothetical protein [Actinomycetes]WKX10597.1 hypothetical protein Q4V64_25090 [Kutzneria buriramensis]GCB47860.1 hypothetical protein SNL152K_5173 [Streptomyces sp. NL15-2K]